MSSPHNIEREALLKKFKGKGGWTYVEIPEIKPNPHAPFGWVRVDVSIDGYELKNYKLMPQGNGQLFMPVKAAIRKVIKKEVGDTVHIKMHPSTLPKEWKSEIEACFALEPPSAYQFFQSLADYEQQQYLNWIYDAKNEDIKTERILHMMNRLVLGKKLFDAD